MKLETEIREKKRVAQREADLANLFANLQTGRLKLHMDDLPFSRSLLHVQYMPPKVLLSYDNDIEYTEDEHYF